MRWPFPRRPTPDTGVDDERLADEVRKLRGDYCGIVEVDPADFDARTWGPFAAGPPGEVRKPHDA